MKEFELTFRLRNNRLKERRLALGLSAKKLSEKLRISYTTYLLLEGLRKEARIINKNNYKREKAGDWSNVVKKIAKFYGVDPSELFPRSVFLIEANKTVRKIDADDLTPILSGNCDSLLPAEFEKTPEDVLINKENMGLVLEACEVLSEREKKIIENRYVNGMNFNECVPEGCSPERTRQIAENSIYRIKSYIRTKELDKINRARFIDLFSRWQFTQAACCLKGLPFGAKIEVTKLADKFGDIGVIEEKDCKRYGLSIDDLKHIKKIVGLVLNEDSSLEREPVMERDALISRCKNYRYWLSRYWDNIPKTDAVCWVLLNPGFADEKVDDPTVRKCIGFSRRWKFGGLYMVNLFAYRATNPQKILEVESPVGKCNSKWLFEIAERSKAIILGWGHRAGSKDFVVAHQNYIQWVETVLRRRCRNKTYWFGPTSNGQPLHPLQLSYATEIEKVFN